MAAPNHLHLAIAAAANVCAEESVEAEKGSAEVTQVQVKSDVLKFLHCSIYWSSVRRASCPSLLFLLVGYLLCRIGALDKTRFTSLASSSGMFPLAQSPLN